jgi:hypothetical protein
MRRPHAVAPQMPKNMAAWCPMLEGRRADWRDSAKPVAEVIASLESARVDATANDRLAGAPQGPTCTKVQCCATGAAATLRPTGEHRPVADRFIAGHANALRRIGGIDDRGRLHFIRDRRCAASTRVAPMRVDMTPHAVGANRPRFLSSTTTRPQGTRT